ncbi:MAG: sulfite exporter TauE/SafE family protein [Woeseiaceae bacterium]|nr:sulfite exporter TauE/SafE family protein [Woeseiaceae bacterium]
MPTDPWFYAAAVPAVLIFGIAKGGFGGSLGVLGVPIMSLVMSPVQAAAILLPILCLMDLLGLAAFRGKWVMSDVRVLIPSAFAGITVGAILYGVLTVAHVKLIVGITALLFSLHYWFVERHKRLDERAEASTAGAVASGLSAGFTSFVAHAGGPPLNMYMLRRNLDRTAYVATTVVFFTAVNYAKLIPYGWLGQLSADNLLASLVLAPLAPIGIATGIWLHRRVSDRFFFRFAYLLLFLVSLKLVSDGFSGP